MVCPRKWWEDNSAHSSVMYAGVLRGAGAAAASQRESGQLESTGETEPLQSSYVGHSRRYHAVLMVRPLPLMLTAPALYVHVQRCYT
jgi:hypothetical protein